MADRGANRGGAAIAVIPARGGSKRIPGKNVRPFCGRPIIEYPIELALGCGLFDRVVVSTDNDDIAAVAAAAGAEVPFRRPPALSDDFALTADVLTHALRQVDPESRCPLACCLYPATPFLRSEDLEAGYRQVSEADTDCAFAVTAYDAPIERAFVRSADGGVVMKWPEYRSTRTNDLPEHFHDAGQFYWVRSAAFLAANDFFSLRCGGVQMPRWRAHDIDTMDDWIRAELVYRALAAEEEKA